MKQAQEKQQVIICSNYLIEIPEFLHKAGFEGIAHILPRKISVITVAKWVAQNMNVNIGQEVLLI